MELVGGGSVINRATPSSNRSQVFLNLDFIHDLLYLIFTNKFPRVCESGGVASEEDAAAAAEVLKLLGASSSPAAAAAAAAAASANNSHVDYMSDDGWDNSLDDGPDDLMKISPKWIKEDQVKQEKNEDDDDYEDYTPSSRGTPNKHITKSPLKSPKKERLDRLKCKKCPKTFAYMAAFTKHKQKHRDEDEDGDDDSEDDEDDMLPGDPTAGQFRCEAGCDLGNGKRDISRSRFKHEISLTRHYMKVHQQPKECCGETFSEYKIYRKHLYKEHHNFQCAECAQTFYSKGQLERHQKWDHETEPQKCPHCPAVVKDIDMHVKNCHTGELMTCSACPYSSRRKQDLESHYRKVHTELNMETCQVCGDRFKMLKNHLERTKCGTGKKAEATIPCPTGCPKMFTLQSSVDKHIRQVHQQIKNKICPFCDYKTYSRFNLNLHVTKMHEGKKMEKQQCQYCDKAPYALDYHMQTYHNDKL